MADGRVAGARVADGRTVGGCMAGGRVVGGRMADRRVVGGRVAGARQRLAPKRTQGKESRQVWKSRRACRQMSRGEPLGASAV